MRTSLSLAGAFALAFLLLASPALAADVDGFSPARGAPGDPVLIRGSGFATEPTVLFGSTAADVLRSNEDAILCRVPDSLSAGDVTISVDGTDASPDFVVLDEATPVVLRLSATKGPAGLAVLVVGRRLGGSSVAFVDESDATAAEVDLRGGRRAAGFRVPDDLDPGTYTLVFTNVAGLDTGDGSPTFEVVQAGEPALESARPEDAPPGAPLLLTGTDLSPPGPCRVVWTDADGNSVRVEGLSNGYDRVRTRVPLRAEPEATYAVHVELRGDASTDDLDVTVGAFGDPTIDRLVPDGGPAGSLFEIVGRFLRLPGEDTGVAMDDGSTSVEARVLFARPGPRPGVTVLVVRVPADLEDGEFDVTVTVGDATSNAATFTVGELDLQVRGMTPHRQPADRRTMPVTIVGTGFGTPRSDTDVRVVWHDGTGRWAGRVIFRSDRMLVVLPPRPGDEPLPEGTYAVTVVRDPDGTADTAAAGPYVVY